MTTARVVPSGGTSLLLEREVQVAALQALVNAARSGGGRFVVVEGSAGIGKTRLLAEARAIARAGERGGRGGRERRRAVRARRGQRRHRQDAPARRGARDRRVGGDGGARGPRRRAWGRGRGRGRPAAVVAARGGRRAAAGR